MTASQAEKLSALVSEVSLQLSELASISKQLAQQDDAVERLKDYSNIVQRISLSIEQSEYSGLFDLISILQDGLTTLIEQNKKLSHDELYVLTKLPDKLLDYISYPTSKLPGLVLLRLFKHQGWIRPISGEEEQILTEFMLPVEEGNEVPMDVADEVEHMGLDFEPDSDQSSISLEPISLSDFVSQEEEPAEAMLELDMPDADLLADSDHQEMELEVDDYDDPSSDNLLVDLGADESIKDDEALLVDLDAQQNSQSEESEIDSVEFEAFETPESISEDFDVEIDV
ncbi:MAG: hypothetical protein OQL09_02100, partial [Gammaproteobacteria bacterium]|nr:hypothetical protein [Gammaproteobacteria bacterium]